MSIPHDRVVVLPIVRSVFSLAAIAIVGIVTVLAGIGFAVLKGALAIPADGAHAFGAAFNLCVASVFCGGGGFTIVLAARGLFGRSELEFAQDRVSARLGSLVVECRGEELIDATAHLSKGRLLSELSIVMPWHDGHPMYLRCGPGSPPADLELIEGLIGRTIERVAN